MKTQQILEWLPLNKILPKAAQPRKHIDEENLENLAHSILEKGILHPLLVEKHLTKKGFYEIVAGERRFRAAQKLKLKEVPCLVWHFENSESFEVALVENIHRENLSPLEESWAYYRLKEEYGLTQDQIAQRLGKPRSTIANFLRLLTLPQKIQEALRLQQLSLGHAKILLTVGTQLWIQQHLFQHILEHDLSVKQTAQLLEELLSNSKEEQKNRKKEQSLSKQLVLFEEKLLYKLQAKVAIKGTEEKGKIEISYYSPQELKALVESLRR